MNKIYKVITLISKTCDQQIFSIIFFALNVNVCMALSL